LHNLHVLTRSNQAIPHSATLKTDVKLLLHDYDNMVRVSVAHTSPIGKKVEKNLYRLLQIFLLSHIQQSHYIIWPVPSKATPPILPDQISDALI